jgi:hypothetical protein
LRFTEAAKRGTSHRVKEYLKIAKTLMISVIKISIIYRQADLIPGNNLNSQHS